MRTRRLGVSTTLALAAGLLVGVPLSAGPAAAAADCLSEPPVGIGKAACDDTVPPETALTAVTTPPNAGGWVATSTMAFTFTGAHTDADADALGFECKLDGPAQAHDWVSCTSPRTYAGLADSDVATYTFSVRSVDTADRAFIYPNSLFPAEPSDDLDGSPATLTWGAGHRRARGVRQSGRLRQGVAAAAGRRRPQRPDPPQQQRGRRHLPV